MKETQGPGGVPAHPVTDGRCRPQGGHMSGIQGLSGPSMNSPLTVILQLQTGTPAPGDG